MAVSVPVGDRSVIELWRDSRGRANGATGWQRLPLAKARAIELLGKNSGRQDLTSSLRVPIVRHLRRNGDTIDLGLHFRFALLSFRFGIIARLERRDDALVFHYLSGEPRDASLVLSIVEDGADSSVLRCELGFDLDSLGWVVKYFLKHHQEIRAGIYTGSVAAILEAFVEQAARSQNTSSKNSDIIR